MLATHDILFFGLRCTEGNNSINQLLSGGSVGAGGEGEGVGGFII